VSDKSVEDLSGDEVRRSSAGLDSNAQRIIVGPTFKMTQAPFERDVSLSDPLLDNILGCGQLNDAIQSIAGQCLQ